MNELRGLQGRALELEREAKRIRDGARIGSMLEGAMNSDVLPAMNALLGALMRAGTIVDAQGANGERDSET